MNKAFVRENDSDDDQLQEKPQLPGGKNYITPAGAGRLQDELRRLKHNERPEVVRIVEWAAGNGDRSENGDYIYAKKKLREIDRRMRFLSKRLESAEVIDPLAINSDQVLFGATVTIRDEQDRERTYSIVGADEIDIERGRISWMSPLARALFKTRAGDIVTFHSPKGVQEVEVLEIRYCKLD